MQKNDIYPILMLFIYLFYIISMTIKHITSQIWYYCGTVVSRIYFFYFFLCNEYLHELDNRFGIINNY